MNGEELNGMRKNRATANFLVQHLRLLQSGDFGIEVFLKICEGRANVVS